MESAKVSPPLPSDLDMAAEIMEAKNKRNAKEMASPQMPRETKNENLQKPPAGKSSVCKKLFIILVIIALVAVENAVLLLVFKLPKSEESATSATTAATTKGHMKSTTSMDNDNKMSPSMNTTKAQVIEEVEMRTTRAPRTTMNTTTLSPDVFPMVSAEEVTFKQPETAQNFSVEMTAIQDEGHMPSVEQTTARAHEMTEAGNVTKSSGMQQTTE